ncbi:MAG: hypothetical protein WCS65_02405 [Verrucomicrobiae bacterium]
MKLTIQVKLEPRPARGSGLNAWMFKTAAALARSRVPQSEAVAFISCDDAKPGEVERQVEQGYAAAFDSRPVRSDNGAIVIPKPRAPKWPDRDDDRLRGVVGNQPAAVEDVIAASPIKPDITRHPLDVLAELHGARGAELICLAPKPSKGFRTLSFNQWARGIRRRWNAGKKSQTQDWQMVVPNLMRAPTGSTLDGKPDRDRTKENACDPDRMRFAVVEVDIPPEDPLCVSLGKTPQEMCASVILSQLDRDKLRMVVMSGGKSLHAWLDVDGMDAAAVARLFRTLAPLGVDPAGRLTSQQFRLPNGFRADKGTRQNVIFWNPKS